MSYKLIRKLNQLGHNVFITDDILKVEEGLKKFKIVVHSNLEALTIKLYCSPKYISQIKKDLIP